MKATDAINVCVVVPTTMSQRKPLLMMALNSLLSQIKAGDEVIVISNYHSAELEDFCERNSIKFKFTDLRPLGDKVEMGVQLSNSEIIAFLEDDDLFSVGKVQSIKEVFLENRQLVYYHNNFSCIDSEGKPTISERIHQINKPILIGRFKGDLQNLSSVIRWAPFGGLSSSAIRKSSVEPVSSHLKNINYMCDQTLFFLSMISEGEAMFDISLLTYYRIHNSGTHAFNSQSDFMKNKKKGILDYFEGWTNILSFCKGTPLYEIAYTEYLYNLTLYNSHVQQQKLRALLNALQFFRQYASQTKLTTALYYTLYLFSESTFGSFLTTLGYQLSLKTEKS